MLKRTIGLSLVTIALIIVIINNSSLKKDLKNHNQQITNFKQETTRDKEKEKTLIPNDYLGYLEIPKYNIKRLIKQGTTTNIINQNIIGLYNNNVSLESESGQIILAGHNNKYVFKNLSKVKINDEIIITTPNNYYKYVVKNLHIINASDYTHFKINSKIKELILVTCIKDKHHRLLIIAYPK